MKKVNYEKEQAEEQHKTNTILWINTVFTIIAGIAMVAIAILTYIK